jgi:putative transposase
MSARLVQELAVDGVPVALTCRVLGISRSGLYDAVGRAPSARAIGDRALTATIVAIHHGSRATYGARRVHAELRLGLGVACGTSTKSWLGAIPCTQSAMTESGWSFGSPQA